MTTASSSVQAAGELLQEIVRAFKVRRLYSEDHPQRTATEAAVAERVARILQDSGALAVSLEEGGARAEEQLVFTPDSESSLISILYHEGIRELAFIPGLDAGELARFLDHVAAVAAAPGLERDLLARLWEETLPHIDYGFVERLADNEWVPEVETRVGADDGLEVGPVVLEPEDQEALEMPLVPLSDPTVYRLSGDELARLRADLDDETARGLLHETITCIRELLIDPPHDDLAPMIGALADIQAGLLREGRAAEVHMLHESLRPYLESPGVDPRAAEELDRLRGEALDPGVMAQLVGRLEEGQADEEELAGYLGLFGPAQLPELMAALPETKRLCQRTKIAEILERLAAQNPGALEVALTRGAEPVAAVAAYLAGTVGRPDIGPVLESALERPEPRVRLEAIQALKHLGESAVAMAARAVDDPDPAVRVYALRHVIAHRYEPAFGKVAALFDRIDEEAESMAERRLVYEAFGALGGSRAVDELARRMKRGVFRRSDREGAVCAVAGLAATRSPASRSLLEEAARDRDQRIREAAEAALTSRSRGEAGSR